MVNYGHLTWIFATSCHPSAIICQLVLTNNPVYRMKEIHKKTAIHPFSYRDHSTWVWLNTSPASPAPLLTSLAVNYITTARRLYSVWMRSAEGHTDWASNRTTWPETCRERAAVGQSYTRRCRSAHRWVAMATAAAKDNTDRHATDGPM